MLEYEHSCVLSKILMVVAIIGALNWGLVGVMDFNLVDYLFGAGSMVSRIVYSLVGLSGLGLLARMFKDCTVCKK